MDRLRIDEDRSQSTTRYFDKPPAHVVKPEDGHEYTWYLGCMYASEEQIKSWEMQGARLDAEQRYLQKNARDNTNPL